MLLSNNQALKDELAEMIRKKAKLEADIDLCGKKLVRAEQLIGGLGGEKTRWNDMADMLSKRYTRVTGDVLLASGMVAYLGAFTLTFRNKCVKEWIVLCTQKSIPCSEQFSLTDTLGDPVLIRDW